MVRGGRRTRRTAATAAAISNNCPQSPTQVVALNSATSSPLKNGVLLVTAASDEYCASPKRKEYKIDDLLSQQNGENLCGVFLKKNGYSAEIPAKCKGLTENKQNGTMVLRANGGSSPHNNAITTNGNEITRFLLKQSKSKSRKNRKKSPNIELVNDDTCDSFTQATTLSNGVEMEPELERNGAIGMDEKEITVLPFQMFSNRSKLATPQDHVNGEGNIFLQEPVLKLNVDSPSTEMMTAPLPVAAKKTSDLTKFGASPTKASNYCLLLNHDSNSGDSGVVVDKLQEILSSPQGLISRQRKPTTPHRILCPSSPQSSVNGCAESQRAEEGDCLMKEEPDYEDAQEGFQGNAKRKLDLPMKCLETDDDKPDQTTTITVTAKTTTTTSTHLGGGKNGVAKSTTVTHQSTMVDFFKVRRSVRKTKKEVEREEQLALEKAILERCEDGLAVKMFDNKGRGIVATRPFNRGEFVVEYIGEFISIAEANRREQLYAEDQSTGCYMYYFKHKNKQYCIDATEETGKLGRLVNHSRNGNLITKTVDVKGRPHLVLIAKEDIEEGKELTYDYGDRSKEALQHHPWLAF